MWILELIEAFGSLFPRLHHVRKTHQAVKFKSGKAVPLGPGLHWYWPIVSEVEELVVVRQTLNLATQAVSAACGRTLALSGVVVYEISDIEKALCKSHDIEETASDVALCCVVEALQTVTYNELQKLLASGDLTELLTKRARSRLRPFGVRVLSCSLTDFSPCLTLRLFSDGSS